MMMPWAGGGGCDRRRRRRQGHARLVALGGARRRRRGERDLRPFGVVAVHAPGARAPALARLAARRRVGDAATRLRRHVGALAQARVLRACGRGLLTGRRDLRTQPRHLVARLAGLARLAHLAPLSPAVVRRQQVAVLLTDGNQLVRLGRERILPEHRSHLLHRRALHARGVLLRLRERAIDRGAARRLAVPAQHRLVHQVGVGALLGRRLARRRRQLREQLAHLRLVVGAVERAPFVSTARQRRRRDRRQRGDD